MPATDPVMTSDLVRPFRPEDLGRDLRLQRERTRPGERKTYKVTFLIGAGFSRSADIPVASEMCKEMLSGEQVELDSLDNADPNTSEYAFLMGRIRTPGQRRDYIRRCVNRSNGMLNWSHILLARMVGSYADRILTTNFDPLIVQALATTDQPIRTFDLNANQKCEPRILEPPTVVYMHGQVHSHLLVNSPHELNVVKAAYPAVLAEAVADRTVIVIGYSGASDPLLDALFDVERFHEGLYWAHYGGRIGDGAHKLLRKHPESAHLCSADDSDTFMRKLVLDGLQLGLPTMVSNPIRAARDFLARLKPFPVDFRGGGDPLQGARAMLDEAEAAVGHAEDELATSIKDAVDKKEWERFERLSGSVPPDRTKGLSRTIGEGYLHRGAIFNRGREFQKAEGCFQQAWSYGVPDARAADLPVHEAVAFAGLAEEAVTVSDRRTLFERSYQRFNAAAKKTADLHNQWGIALTIDAEFIAQRDRATAEARYKEAYAHYERALTIDPNENDACSNWATGLASQAKRGLGDGDDLYEKAYEKFQMAMSIRPDSAPTLHNWGQALCDQAKGKGRTAEAVDLLNAAIDKCQQAIELRPDRPNAYFSRGQACLSLSRVAPAALGPQKMIGEATRMFEAAAKLVPDYELAYLGLASVHAIRGEEPAMLEALERWRELAQNPRPVEIEDDPSFATLLATTGLRDFLARLRS